MVGEWLLEKRGCEHEFARLVSWSECHTYVTTDRVRGSKGSKVLRTRKVKQHTNSTWYNPNSWYNWFCSMSCYNDFANKYADAMRRIAPRTEPLETPIEDPKKKKRERL